MKIDLQNSEVKFAIEAVDICARLAEKIRQEIGSRQITKSDQSPVTIGDFAVQAIIAYYLSRAFPHDVLVGEEKSEAIKTPEMKATLDEITQYVKQVLPEATTHTVCDWIDRGTGQPGERFWTVDPIDGTKGFVRGDQYVVALALVEKGKVVLSVLGCPRLSANGETEKIGGPGSLVLARIGEGAWITSNQKPYQFKQLKVSSRAIKKEMQVLRSKDAKHTNAEKTKELLEILEVKKAPLLMDSQVKYVLVALGLADLFFYLVPTDRPNHRMKIWDVAPGALVVHEAGGETSDLFGKKIDFSAGVTIAHNPGVLISNHHFHQAALKAMTQVGLTPN